MTPLVPLGWLGYLLRGAGARDHRLLLALWPVPLIAFYLFFKAGDAWWWTRYLLPAVAPLILGATLLAQAWVHSRSRRPRAADDLGPARGRLALAGLAVGVVLVASWSHVAAVRLWELAPSEAVYRESVHGTDELIPPGRAFIIATQVGTAVEIYSEHIPVRWEWLDPALFAEFRERTERAGFRWYALAYPHERVAIQERAPGEWLHTANFRHVSLWRLSPLSPEQLVGLNWQGLQEILSSLALLPESEGPNRLTRQTRRAFVWLRTSDRAAAATLLSRLNDQFVELAKQYESMSSAAHRIGQWRRLLRDADAPR